jgi:hypothetical protein
MRFYCTFNGVLFGWLKKVLKGMVPLTYLNKKERYNCRIGKE